MKITILGTGTSSGVPVLTCKCPVCTSTNPKDKRLRVSVLIQKEDTNVLIDSGPDLRQQLLSTGIESLDAVVYTHEHKDHTAGMDDIRPFNYLNGKRYMNLYARPQVLDQLKREFHYAFLDEAYPGVPLIKTNIVENKPFEIGGLTFQPIEVLHYKLPVFGYRIDDFVYITDANFISEEEKQKVKGCKVLVLDALQKQDHISHFTLAQAVDLAKEIDADQTYFTHISHKMGLHDEINAELPEKMQLAYDGLTIEF
ncbi:MBL fold metallo-hydrolase [Jiulongibacter sp. NS-SX5]|uniref:MBL fold metallo-hydrolase n=1 Tax=Jiulongibacter sp. NS-SX5 TaxID=3463854 RepID=UPI004058EDA6